MTNQSFYDIVYGRMEELRSVLYAQKPVSVGAQEKDPDKTRILMEVEVVRTRITLACTECKQRNYNTKKDKKTHPDRMETKKYCRFCKRHTMHKETK